MTKETNEQTKDSVNNHPLTHARGQTQFGVDSCNLLKSPSLAWFHQNLCNVLRASAVEASKSLLERAKGGSAFVNKRLARNHKALVL
mmetsp:Transcript_894/g.1803  ORF Transcript_894/g.1803 Transcript_894/m.1803 type:complete len:87 (-) Transcript_894:96-356(-)